MILRLNNICYIIIIFLSNVACLFSQSYIGKNGYGKLTLKDDKKFYFHYWDCGIDSGYYQKRGDTIILQSSTTPIKISTIDCIDQNNIIYFNNLSELEIYNSSGILLKKEPSRIDTVNGFKVFVENIELKKGQIINFHFLHQNRKVIWNQDFSNCLYIELDERYGRKVYFDNYMLLAKHNSIQPINIDSNKLFMLINGFEFLPMKKDHKGKYKKYLSGFGIVQ